ncbi:hypothetical protein BGZ68_006668 [Mortierella alpina]|nr:hypothetical protein BGZ68_006668 [Mortierella alpina]
MVAFWRPLAGMLAKETRAIIQQKIYDIIKEFGQHQVTFDTVQELVVPAEIQVRDIFLHIVTEILIEG